MLMPDYNLSFGGSGTAFRIPLLDGGFQQSYFKGGPGNGSKFFASGSTKKPATFDCTAFQTSNLPKVSAPSINKEKMM
jgi:hypothetical protein